MIAKRYFIMLNHFGNLQFWRCDVKSTAAFYAASVEILRALTICRCDFRRSRAGPTSGIIGAARTAADVVQDGAWLDGALAAATPRAESVPAALTARITARSLAGIAPGVARASMRPIRALRTPTLSAILATALHRTIPTIGENARTARDSSSRRRMPRAPPRRACWWTSRPIGSSWTTGSGCSRKTWKLSWGIRQWLPDRRIHEGSKFPPDNNRSRADKDAPMYFCLLILGTKVWLIDRSLNSNKCESGTRYEIR